MRGKNWNHCSNYQLACTKNLALTHFLSLSSYCFLNFRMAGSACDAGVKAIDEQLFRAIERKRVRKDTEKLGRGYLGRQTNQKPKTTFVEKPTPTRSRNGVNNSSTAFCDITVFP
jgi:hypothetical protein